MSEYIYIISIQRGKRARGISLITNNYEDAITNFYNKGKNKVIMTHGSHMNYIKYHLMKI
jgi:hypothetical protein